MFIAVTPISERLTMSNSTFIVITFVFLEEPPSKEVTLCLETIIKDNKFTNTTRTKDSECTQSNMAYNE